MIFRFKVGVVTQTETAALKAAKGESKGFDRQLTGVYTRATLGADEALAAEAHQASSAQPAYIVALVESLVELRCVPVAAATLAAGSSASASASSSSSSSSTSSSSSSSPTPSSSSDARAPAPQLDRVYFALLALDPNSGHVLYDTFTDSFMRTHLETRLAHIAPSELLLPDRLSAESEQVIRHGLAGRSVRVQRYATKTHSTALMKAAVNTFFSLTHSHQMSGASSTSAAAALSSSHHSATVASTPHKRPPSLVTEEAEELEVEAEVEAGDHGTKRHKTSAEGRRHVGADGLSAAADAGGLQELDVLHWPETLTVSLGTLLTMLMMMITMTRAFIRSILITTYF
jgi:DNA mismatch repair ATPase MutS